MQIQEYSFYNGEHSEKTIADRIIEFNASLDFQEPLPDGISVMNPFKESKYILKISSSFYRKYYSDYLPRYMIIGINPGRFGGGITGVPFTDTQRLSLDCGISFEGQPTRELSSVFIYEMINAYGGVSEFYKKFYFGAVSPLGFTKKTLTGKEKNYNYYSNKALLKSTYSFIVSSMKKQLEIGLKTEVCFCLGTGKNFQFLNLLNKEYNFFGQIVPLDHPRFIMQYKLKLKNQYIQKYLSALNRI
jgi:hypothetical protein